MIHDNPWFMFACVLTQSLYIPEMEWKSFAEMSINAYWTESF